MKSCEYPLRHYAKPNTEPNTPLAFLEPAINCMFQIMDRYIEMCNSLGEPDCPFGYNERATVSILAGGIWQSNPDNLVLEEYAAEKRGKSGRRFKGKEDLWFRVGIKSCFASAEQWWAFCLSRPTAAEEAKSIIKKLKTEADTVWRSAIPWPSSAIDHAFGIFFVVPRISEKKQEKDTTRLSDLKNELSNQLEQFVSTGNYNVLRGSYFPAESLTKNHFFGNKKRGRFAYPGVDVLICERVQKK